MEARCVGAQPFRRRAQVSETCSFPPIFLPGARPFKSLTARVRYYTAPGPRFDQSSVASVDTTLIARAFSEP